MTRVMEECSVLLDACFEDSTCEACWSGLDDSSRGNEVSCLGPSRLCCAYESVPGCSAIDLLLNYWSEKHRHSFCA